MAKDEYEISLWEDYIVPASGNVPEHYSERKLAVIGSNTMTSECRAIEPKLVENINGTHTFTFKMFYLYKDRDGNSYQNPFLNLLVNERKVKVKWKGEWYDLIIKNCQEDSAGKSITYTCKDLFINELSKNGFDLVFDAELGNNQGTAAELGAKVLEGTDWLVGTSDTIIQEKEEPVYEVYTLRTNSNFKNELTGNAFTMPIHKTYLIFYQQVQDFIKECPDVGDHKGGIHYQCVYADNYETDTNSQLVNNATHLIFGASGSNWYMVKKDGSQCIRIGSDNNPLGYIYYQNGVSNYRAKRLIKNQKCILDPLTDKYCYVYKANANGSGIYSGLFEENNEIYEYRSTEYKDPTVVNNLVVNGKDFVSTEGWIGEDLVFKLSPPFSDALNIDTYSAKSYLRLSSQETYYNAGITQSSNYIPNGFSIGDKYILRYKVKADVDGSPNPEAVYITNPAVSNRIVPKIVNYNNDMTPGTTSYFSVSSPQGDATTGWVEFVMTCIKSVTRADLYNEKVGLFLQVGGQTRWLEEVQFFPYVLGSGDTRINPGEMDKQSVVQIYYSFYNHTKSNGLISADDLHYLYQGTNSKPSGLYSYLDPQYNDNFEKIRSITAKQSNRFNLIQSIAETFECWAQFTIEHEEDGSITLDENGVPQKYVTFKSQIGQETGIGFIYGIDLKTIQRTIQSDQIVTKTIVANNSNQYAKDGFCSIARSEENYPRTNFILNFDYYVSHGLINAGELNKDLYLSTNAIGYYYWLNYYNTEYDAITEELAEKRNELLKQEGYLKVYSDMVTSLIEQVGEIKSELKRLAGAPTYADASPYINKNKDTVQIKSRLTALTTLENNLSSYQTMRDSIEAAIEALKKLIYGYEDETTHEHVDGLIDRQEECIEGIKSKDLEFYKKYSRYIQEGSWTKADYIDDNLYYLDALSVAYTSSRPQISYNISVLRLSSLEEFKNKVFRLGDISFIQDTEFFGYTYPNGVPTPYKEKVLVSEVTSNFDSPENDSFKVQNYKTQFEDLFQRITSTTQSLQYASGEYARAAAIVETNGTINGETLQASIAVNEQLVYSAQNEAVVTDSTGITVTDATNPNKKTKVTSGGIFITTDGGATWKNAVRGEGIATQYLTAGNINVNSINIMDGTYSTFRWDSTGINAYDQTDVVINEQTYHTINTNKYVRFDHFGIYGINNGATASEFVPATEGDIWNNAKFGMTWSGFFVKNDYGNHYVEVSSVNDIAVVDTTQNNPIDRIKIGVLDRNNQNIPTNYGIRLKDSNGVATLETIDDGQLWLQDTLHIGTTKTTEDENEITHYEVSIGHLPIVGAGRKIVYNNEHLDEREVVEDSGIYIRRNFDLNNKFVVWEDGVMYAKDGYFDGYINATGGNIGGLTIDEVIDAGYKVVITSNNGTVFESHNISATLTAHLYYGEVEQDVAGTSGYSYQWYVGGTAIPTATSKTLVLTDETISGNFSVYSCTITKQGGNND